MIENLGRSLGRNKTITRSTIPEVEIRNNVEKTKEGEVKLSSKRGKPKMS